MSQQDNSSSRKEDIECLENPKQRQRGGNIVEKEEINSLTPEHREYLLQRHGTLDLDTVPAFSDADPYNWPAWKKTINLILVAFHACMSTFISSAIIPAYDVIAADLGVSLQRTTYLTSLQIAILGAAPLFWRPLSNRYGRRPVFLLSLICSLVGNIGCAESYSYASMAACRAIVAFFISPAGAIGSAVVAETFFKKDRARYMGVWTLMVTLGVPVAPFIFGFVTYYIGYRWIYWILAMINGVQFIAYLFLGPETRYVSRNAEFEGSSFKTEYLTLRRIDPTPFSTLDFIKPLTLARKACVSLSSISYSMTFLFGSVLLTVEIPELFGEKFGLNAEQMGLQFVGVIVGSIVGEQIGGFMSDAWMNRRAKKINQRPAPEYRLWLSYIGFLLTMVGVVVFLVQINNAEDGKWNVTPIIGAGIAGCGNQIVTTVLVTYAVDSCSEDAGSVGVLITLIRQTWGFIGPFWFPSMFDSIGLIRSVAVVISLIAGVSIVPVMLLQWKGHSWR